MFDKTFLYMELATILLQITTAAPAPAAATPQPEGLSIFSLIVKGGAIMIPIFALSIGAVYLFIERLLY
ncbi:MAG TPA: hypothetical protein VK202_09595, partial [Bacteroidia bacterium]|nr:hypothetical protein [Bacteroidia bacterium]